MATETLETAEPADAPPDMVVGNLWTRVDRLADAEGPETKACRIPEAPWSRSGWAEQWFPDTYRVTSGVNRGSYTAETARAVERCSGCPFKVTCGMAAIDIEGDAPERNRFGVFGGMDPRDRYEAMVEMNDGVRPRSGGYTIPTEPAEPLERLLTAAKERAGSGVSVDTRIAEAVGISSDTVRQIRTGRRDRVRATTYTAIMAYFGQEV